MSMIDVLRLTGADAEAALASADFAVLPLGSVEWHGPHLPLGTDTLLAEGFAGELGDGDWAAVRYPTVALTAVPGQTRHYLGTIGVAPDTMVAYLSQVIEGIVASGPRRVLILNAHDANMATARAAMEWVSGRVACSLLLVNWFHLVPDDDTRRIFGPQPAYGHGGPFETAGVMAFAPEAVRLDEVPDVAPRPDIDAPVEHALVESQPSPWYGWSGLISLVETESGKQLIEVAAPRLLELVAAWLRTPPPEEPGHRPSPPPGGRA